MERRNEDLTRKMDSAHKGAEKAKSRSINENTELISYCNELRKVGAPTIPHKRGGCCSGFAQRMRAALGVNN